MAVVNRFPGIGIIIYLRGRIVPPEAELEERYT
jgi:hypothetical protein